MLHDARAIGKTSKRFTNEEAHDFVARSRREAGAVEKALKAEAAAAKKKAAKRGTLSNIEPVVDRSHVADDYLNFDELELA